MIVTSMQLTLSSRRDIAVLQKESPSFWAERMSILTSVARDAIVTSFGRAVHPVVRGDGYCMNYDVYGLAWRGS
jgi:hypothetical protein